MNSDDIFREMVAKLDQLVMLASTSAVRGLKPNEAISILGQIGLDRNVIAQIVGTTPDTVSVRLSEAKSRKTKAGKASRKKH